MCFFVLELGCTILQQGERNSDVRLRAALKYLVLALSGYMDDVLTEYKVMKTSSNLFGDIKDCNVLPGILFVSFTVKRVWYHWLMDIHFCHLFSEVNTGFLKRQLNEICYVALSFFFFLFLFCNVCRIYSSHKDWGTISPGIISLPLIRYVLWGTVYGTLACRYF